MARITRSGKRHVTPIADTPLDESDNSSQSSTESESPSRNHKKTTKKRTAKSKLSSSRTAAKRVRAIPNEDHDLNAVNQTNASTNSIKDNVGAINGTNNSTNITVNSTLSRVNSTINRVNATINRDDINDTHPNLNDTRNHNTTTVESDDLGNNDDVWEDDEPDPTQTQALNVHASDTILPNINDYQQLVKDWPKSRIYEFKRGKKLGNLVPPGILAEAISIQKLYHHHKLMLSMMGKVSLYTLNKAIGELGATRKADAYRLWLKYSKDSVKYKMPRKSAKGALSQRNKELGAIWSGLSPQHQRVFHPSAFYELSGLPPPKTASGNDREDEGQSDDILTPEERPELEPLYEEMVCVEKVASVYAKVAAGLPEGNSTLPEYNRKSLKCVENLHNQIENEANRMGFAYYFLASGTHAASNGNSSEPAWCREFTSHPDLAVYVSKTANFPTIFAAQVQGLSVNEVVAMYNGKSKQLKPPAPGDVLKGELSRLLRSELKKITIVEPSRGFPRGPNPAARVEKWYSVKLIQLPGSALTPEALELGFTAMNSKRKLWLQDLKDGLFQIQKIGDDSDDVSEVPGDDADAVLEDGGNIDDVEEEEEWGGLEWAGI